MHLKLKLAILGTFTGNYYSKIPNRISFTVIGETLSGETLTGFWIFSRNFYKVLPTWPAKHVSPTTVLAKKYRNEIHTRILINFSDIIFIFILFLIKHGTLTLESLVVLDCTKDSFILFSIFILFICAGTFTGYNNYRFIFRYKMLLKCSSGNSVFVQL